MKRAPTGGNQWGHKTKQFDAPIVAQWAPGGNGHAVTQFTVQGLQMF